METKTLNILRKKQSGITLITLVVTIIILLILAGITIMALTQTGLFSKLNDAKEKTNRKAAEEHLKLKVSEVQVDKLGNATIDDLIANLQNDPNAEYLIALAQTSKIKGELPSGISEAEYIYITYNGFEFKVDKGLNIEFVGGKSASSNSGTGSQTLGGGSGNGETTGECSRYIDVNVNGAFLGKMTLSVDVPDTDSVKSIKYYVDGQLVHSGLEKKYTVTGLENKSYTVYGIIEYNNVDTSKTATILNVPEANWYVATTGSDSNGTGTTEKPFATIEKAIQSATAGDSIFIMPGYYELGGVVGPNHVRAGINITKNVTIFGANEDTVLYYDATGVTLRDGPFIIAEQTSDSYVLRNVTVIYKPKSGENYQKALIDWGKGSIENTFFRVIGSNKASYCYDNTSRQLNIKNCTFFHDLGECDKDYSGSPVYDNIAANVEASAGTKNNFRIDTFNNANSTTSLSDLINNSRNSAIFNNNSAGVFYGTYAW